MHLLAVFYNNKFVEKILLIRLAIIGREWYHGGEIVEANQKVRSGEMTKVILKPFELFIGTIFLFLLSAVNNHGMALILLSLVVNILLLPFYNFAEKIQKKERAVQQRMKPKIEEFESVYEGYELHLYIQNVYRLNDYHPIYSLRGLVSLLIQFPFFIGAYRFLSTYEGFQGVSFLFLSNLAQPDALLTIGGFTINLLPFVMTGVNLLSGYVYATTMSKREKMKIVVVALVFLVLLYNAPSSLLVYWTFNNIFSLVKNLYAKMTEVEPAFQRGELK